MGILKDNRYHSPEDSETDEEGVDGKRAINVYNLSWRSREVRYFVLIYLLLFIKVLTNMVILQFCSLLSTLDHHAFSLQSAQLSRPRNYDDERFVLNVNHPNNALGWTFVPQEDPGNSDFSALNTPIDAPHTPVEYDNE